MKISKNEIRKNICMVVFNNVKYDSRVRKEAIALSEEDYKITIFGIIEEKNDKKNFLIKPNIEVQLIDIKTKNTLPKKPWAWIIKYIEYVFRLHSKLIKNKYYFIHAHNLESLFASYFVLFAKKSKPKIIYDSHELFTEMAGNRPKLINTFWKITERKLLKKVDKVIAANESRAKIMRDEYGAKELPVTILNIPDEKVLDNFDISKETKEYFFQFDSYDIVLYQGGITKNRNIHKLIESVRYWDKNLILMLLGKIIDKAFFDSVIKKNHLENRIILHNSVPNDILLQYTFFAKIGVVIYDASTRNNYYCAPNKLFEYALMKKPIAGCNFPEITKIINKYHIGKTFDSENPKSIAYAINELDRNYKNYSKKEKFDILFKDINWKNQVEKLINIYEEL